jgi:hypothetical protein
MRAAVLLVVLAPGCAIGEGHGFVTLEAGTLRVAFEPGAARDLGGGTFFTDLGTRIRFDTARLEIGTLGVETLGGGSQGTFDPSSPPPGYTLCHGGHCHAEDGRLVPYAEVEAELAGGAASFASVFTASVGAGADLLAAAPLPLAGLEPAELPQVDLRRVTLDLGRLEIAGAVDIGGRELPLEVDLDLAGSASGGLEIPVDRSGPRVRRPRAELVLDGTIFDGIDLGALERQGTIRIGAPGDPGAEPLARAVLGAALKLELEEVQ